MLALREIPVIRSMSSLSKTGAVTNKMASRSQVQSGGRIVRKRAFIYRAISLGRQRVIRALRDRTQRAYIVGETAFDLPAIPAPESAKNWPTCTRRGFLYLLRTHYPIFQYPEFALGVFFVSTRWTRRGLLKPPKGRSFIWATISFIKFPAVAIQVAFAFLHMVRAYDQKLVTESSNKKFATFSRLGPSIGQVHWKNTVFEISVRWLATDVS